MYAETLKIRQNGQFQYPAKFVQQNFKRFIAELQTFIKIPSVSSDKSQALNCAAWLVNHLSMIGFEAVRTFSTNGNPIVYGELISDISLPTLLIYGHYDVVPTSPNNQWQFEPFSATIHQNRIYGRGASDDKGQLFTHLKAIESILQTKGKLPINIKCVFEGEEEIGSINFERFVKENQDLLSADVAVVSDMDMISSNQPALTYGMRGNLSAEIRLKTAENNLHSGNFGGAIPNPILILADLLAKIQEPSGQVLIPHFYDKVAKISENERFYQQKFGKTDQQIRQNARSFYLNNLDTFSASEQISFLPSLTITSFKGGFQGEGTQSIIPSQAIAKLNFRLVAEQNPYEIAALLRKFVSEISPQNAEIDISTSAHAFPYQISTEHPAFQAAASAYEMVFKQKPLFIKSGGTIPVLSIFKKILDIDTIMMGFGLPNDNKHAPNEYFELENFYKGILTSIAFINNLNPKNHAHH